MFVTHSYVPVRDSFITGFKSTLRISWNRAWGGLGTQWFVPWGRVSGISLHIGRTSAGKSVTNAFLGAKYLVGSIWVTNHTMRQTILWKIYPASGRFVFSNLLRNIREHRSAMCNACHALWLAYLVQPHSCAAKSLAAWQIRARTSNTFSNSVS